jgi:general stress protein YciG
MTKPHGFAAMTAEQHSEISRLGGRAVHESGRAHHWTKEAAREAGRKGGIAAGKRARERARQAAAQEASTSPEVSQ